ncbi:MAG: hypothetical protein BWX47_01693 [candidate division Hyd24-12 bacterium ADurb.Bin004]|nr:MAG: hypothetical protein BWX47_01693 [candidate division Hyd24-12 bacterium ADurb.Bin004]
MITGSESCTSMPAYLPASAVKTPASSTGLKASSPYRMPAAKSSVPWPGAVWTQPVPSSMVTCSAVMTLETSPGVRGCFRPRPSRSEPLNFGAPPPGIPTMPGTAEMKSPLRLDATRNLLSPASTITYSSAGFRATALLAGSVQGVVVQMTTSVPFGTPLACHSSGESCSNATQIEGDFFCEYSTSASARAVRQVLHQLIGRSPW